MKKYLYSVWVLVLVFALTGCHTQSFSGSRIGNDHKLIMEYSIFNTTDSQTLKLEKGDILEVEIVSDSGKLSVFLKNDQDDNIYKGNDVPTGNFQITIEESGTYRLLVTGDKAKGSLSVKKKSVQTSSGADMESIMESYYTGQDSPAFKMLHKSIFKNLLNNGWLDDMKGMENAVWNYNTFAEYSVLNEGMDTASEGGELYYCTFSADHDKYGYVVVEYYGDSMSKIRAVETPYLYDLQTNIEKIKEELAEADIDLTYASASRVQSYNEEENPVEGIHVTDDNGHTWFYRFL